MLKVKLETVENIGLHDNVFMLFDSYVEFFHCLVPFVEVGLQKNERCMIVLDDLNREDVLRNLKYLFRKGINSIEETAKGSIVIEQFKNIYLKSGDFDLEKILENYLGYVDLALEKDYAGLRVFVEVSSSIKEKIKPEDFIAWEKMADKYFNQVNFLAVCAYNKKYFSNEFITQLSRIHPVEIDLINTRFLKF